MRILIVLLSLFVFAVNVRAAGVIFTATMPDGPWTPWLTNLSDGLIPVSLNETQRFWKL